MRVEIAKHPGEKGVLRCTRADGSVTWQRQSALHAAHFALHDITHFAVETELGLSHGFFGLVASGWEIDDTTGKGARGALPAEAILAEHLVGLLDMERAAGDEWAASDMVEQLRIANVPGIDEHASRLTDAAIARVRSRRDELAAEWHSLPSGATLTLEFHGSQDS